MKIKQATPPKGFPNASREMPRMTAARVSTMMRKMLNFVRM